MTKTKMIKFIVGEVYKKSGLYADSYFVECVSRTDTTVSFKEEDCKEADIEEIKIEFDRDDELGIEWEICEAWEYKGHKAYIHANKHYN